jgi:hypothetical protein
MRVALLLLLCSVAMCSAKKRGGAAPQGVTQGAFELAAHTLAPDVFSGLPRSFLPEYKTPCWHVEGVLQCLPYYYLLGVFQCGVLDLHERMLQHPDVAVSRFRRSLLVRCAHLSALSRVT